MFLGSYNTDSSFSFFLYFHSPLTFSIRSEQVSRQWRRLLRARGHVCPTLYKWLGTRGTVSRRTENKKALTKLYLYGQKVELQDKKITFFRDAWRRTCAGAPTFKFVPTPPLLNSFRRHCVSLFSHVL